ncbi:hypothetical protein BJY01DRAFT_255016 [Aspergillus pseudoustus]|uniref:Myb-like domain-containing protein n=1 Tax=Aspergillus pseudoustus TaxID=1810923 RepID=A0ABR4INM4_9EURO
MGYCVLWSEEDSKRLWDLRRLHHTLSWPEFHKLGFFGRSESSICHRWKFIRNQRQRQGLDTYPVGGLQSLISAPSTSHTTSTETGNPNQRKRCRISDNAVEDNDHDKLDTLADEALAGCKEHSGRIKRVYPIVTSESENESDPEEGDITTDGKVMPFRFRKRKPSTSSDGHHQDTKTSTPPAALPQAVDELHQVSGGRATNPLPAVNRCNPCFSNKTSVKIYRFSHVEIGPPSDTTCSGIAKSPSASPQPEPHLAPVSTPILPLTEQSSEQPPPSTPAQNGEDRMAQPRIPTSSPHPRVEMPAAGPAASIAPGGTAKPGSEQQAEPSPTTTLPTTTNNTLTPTESTPFWLAMTRDLDRTSERFDAYRKAMGALASEIDRMKAEVMALRGANEDLYTTVIQSAAERVSLREVNERLRHSLTQVAAERDKLKAERNGKANNKNTHSSHVKRLEE